MLPNYKYEGAKVKAKDTYNAASSEYTKRWGEEGLIIKVSGSYYEVQYLDGRTLLYLPRELLIKKSGQ